jgi:hypothetical protein
MPARSIPPPKGLFRKAERVFIGMIMGVLALILERLVVHSLRKSGREEKTPPPMSITSKGGSLHMDPE